MNEQPPQDYAGILEKQFTTVKAPAGKPRFKLSARNRRKLERIRQKVRQLRGQ